MSLSVKKVAKLVRAGKPGRWLDSGATGVRGLYLVVANKRAASYQLRYELAGRGHWMGLGSTRDLDLSQARERAKLHRQKLLDKIDPLEDRRAERAARAAANVRLLTFKEAALAYLEDHREAWRSRKHEFDWARSLVRYVYPVIGALDVRQIGRPEVLRVLEQKVEGKDGTAGKFWHSRTVTADRVRSRIELVLSFAAARGHRSSSEPNPAAWTELKHILPSPSKTKRVAHLAAIPFAEVPAVMTKLAARHESIAAKALQFAILTATRTSEVLGSTSFEVDFDTATWTIPGPRMKGGKEHRVPLPSQAVALLRSLYTEDGNPYLFIGGTQPRLSAGAMGRILKGIGRAETVHGTRSSFSDWAHEQSAFDNITIEQCLAHSVGSAVEKAYRRGTQFEKRRRLMQAWADFVTTPPAKQASNNVTPIRERA
jgi:integrase